MGIHAHEQKLFIYARIQNKLTYFDLFYHFIMGKIGPKFSHLLTVRAEGADPPHPSPYGQPDRKKTVFFLDDFPYFGTDQDLVTYCQLHPVPVSPRSHLE